MADDSFDICEYVYEMNHEVAMRRLLSLLRQSQSHCTDTECFDELPRLTGTPNVESNSFVLMAICWMVIALVFFLLRPKKLRNKSDDSSSNFNGTDRDGRPPLPPTVN